MLVILCLATLRLREQRTLPCSIILSIIHAQTQHALEILMELRWEGLGVGVGGEEQGRAETLQNMMSSLSAFCL